MKLTFKLVNFKQRRMSSRTLLGLVKSLEGLKRTRRVTSPKEEEFSHRLPSDPICTIGSPGLWYAGPHCRCGLDGLHRHMSQSLMISLPVYTSYRFYFSGEV